MEALAAFAIAMTILAASPGPGLAAVLSRSSSAGFCSGMRVVLGLILVDFIFLGVAIAGLSAVAAALGPVFQVIKYLAAAYLVYVGIQTVRKASPQELPQYPTNQNSVVGDVMLGSLVTLGNPKAILFYGALLPTFFDVSQLVFADFLALCAVIVLVSLAVYGAYISLTSKIVNASRGNLLRWLQRVSGFTLIGAGAILAARE